MVTPKQLAKQENPKTITVDLMSSLQSMNGTKNRFCQKKLKLQEKKQTDSKVQLAEAVPLNIEKGIARPKYQSVAGRLSDMAASQLDWNSHGGGENNNRSSQGSMSIASPTKTAK